MSLTERFLLLCSKRAVNEGS